MKIINVAAGIMIIILLLMPTMPLGMVNAKEPILIIPTYANRSLITINNNADFTAPNGVSAGDGSAGNPYIIEGWEINALGLEYGIYIKDTTDYFIIQDCYIHNASTGRNDWSETAVYMYNVSNGTIDNCKIGGTKSDIKVKFSDNIKITNITFITTKTGQYNLYLYYTNNSYIYNIEAFAFNFWVDTLCRLEYSNLNIIERYEFNGANHSTTNIYFYNSNNNTLKYNNISNSFQNGIALSLSNDNIINNNNISNSFYYGVMFYHPSLNNLFYNNNIFNNTYNIMEYNLGKNIFNNSYINGGNYWDDYIGIDVMSGVLQNIPGSDGIGDTAFEVGYTVPTRNDNNNDELDEITNYDYYPFLHLINFIEDEEIPSNDTDEDGLPDDWEQQIIDANVTDDIETLEDVLPSDDFDGDGYTNEEEYIGETDPTNELDYPESTILGDILYLLLIAILPLIIIILLLRVLLKEIKKLMK